MKIKVIFLTSVLLINIVGLIFYLIYKNTDLEFRFESSNEKYGKSRNELRNNLGIPIVESDWFTEDLSTQDIGTFKSPRRVDTYWHYQKWSDFKEHDFPHHKEKTLHRRNGKLFSELDRFENNFKDSIIYTLELLYFFDKDETTLEDSTNRLIIYNIETDTFSEEITLSESKLDSVLINWGINE